MPELPEVEHVVRALRRAVVGRQIVTSEVRLKKLIAPISPSAFNRKLKALYISGVSRRGKYILIELTERAPKIKAPLAQRAQSLVLAVHLRMTGKFLYQSADDEIPKHTHAIFYLDNDRRLLFRDQRQFGVMKLVSQSRLSKTKGVRELAPEPFGDEFSVAYLKDVLTRSQRSLKTLLLDQTRVLGLGNIYASEALFRAGVNPFKIAARLSSPRTARLHQAILEVLSDAIADSSTSRIDLEHPDGFSYGEAFERFWQVYEREGEPCASCSTRIRRKTHGGRSTYWCPKCQRN
jgi:formamidopyrimidine-DNA glycosylase